MPIGRSSLTLRRREIRCVALTTARPARKGPVCSLLAVGLSNAAIPARTGNSSCVCPRHLKAAAVSAVLALPRLGAA